MVDENLKRIQKDVDEMNKSFDSFGEPTGTEAPKTSAPKTTGPNTESPSTEAPFTEAPKTEAPRTSPPTTKAPVTAAPVTTAPITAPPENELDSIKKENEALRKKIEEMSVPKTTAPKTTAPVTDIPLTLQEFVGELDLDEVGSDPKKLNDLLNKVYSKAINDARKILGEGILRSIPDIVKTNIQTLSNLREASDKFYNENKDLQPFKRVVAAVFEEVASDNPDKTYDEILGDVATEVRKRLELHRRATEPKDMHPKLPHKKGQPRRTPGKPSTDPLLAEIDEMEKSLNQ